MNDKALEKSVEKIYEQLSETGQISKEQFMIIQMYEKKKEKNILDTIMEYGKQVNKIIDNIFPVDGGSKHE